MITPLWILTGLLFASASILCTHKKNSHKKLGVGLYGLSALLSILLIIMSWNQSKPDSPSAFKVGKVVDFRMEGVRVINAPPTILDLESGSSNIIIKDSSFNSVLETPSTNTSTAIKPK